jgi:hypothetical protein
MFEASAMDMSNDTPRRLGSVRIGVATLVVAGVVAAGGATTPTPMPPPLRLPPGTPPHRQRRPTASAPT